MIQSEDNQESKGYYLSDWNCGKLVFLSNDSCLNSIRKVEGNSNIIIFSHRLFNHRFAISHASRIFTNRKYRAQEEVLDAESQPPNV